MTTDAATANDQGKPGAAAQGQQSGKEAPKKPLDELLAEFQPKGSSQAGQAKATDTADSEDNKPLTKADLVAMRAEIRKEVTAEVRAEAKAKADFEAATEVITDVAGVKTAKAERYLLGCINASSEATTAWVARHQNPKAWSEVVKRWAEELAEDVGDVAEKRGGNRGEKASVRAAAQTRTGAPSSPKVEFWKMSDAEVASWKKANLKQ